jgi:signal transduction histidine kinase/DNA-binding NarL/FixJ family response regulator
MGTNDWPGSGRSFLLFIVLLLGMTLVGPQTGYGADRIFKYFKNYSPGDYLMQPQNWYILQDKCGIIYVANQSGLLEFDGVSWKEIKIPNLTARSIAIDDGGTIYVGGKDEIGFLAPDKKGTLTYQSLLRHLHGSKRNFGNVWKTHWTKEGIYYYTSKFLFRWDSNSRQMNVWEPESIFTAPCTWKEKFYIQQRTVGLMQIIGDSLVLAPGGETFTGDISVMIPYDDEKLLLGTREKGFYLYNGMKTIPFPTGVDDYLKEKLLYHGIRLSCGDFALATRYGGLVILDPQARLKEIFDKDSGLPDNNVWYVFEDFQGNLWLALNKGISKIEYSSPFSIYDDKRSNLPGIVLSAVRHGPHQEMYIGTTSGLFSLTPTGKFIPVPLMSGMCWSLLSTGESLLAALDQGIFQVENNNPRRIIDSPAYVLTRSTQDTKRIWAGTREGLTSLYLGKNTGRWVPEYKFENINQDIRTIQEDKQGNLWIGTVTRGVLKVEFPAAGTVANPVVNHYGPGEGLPHGEVHVCFAAGHIIFATEKGVYRFDEKKNVFIPDPIFGKEFADGSRSVFRIAEDMNKNIRFHSRRRNFQAAPLADGTYEINQKPFLRIPPTQVNAIYPDPGRNIIWLAGNDGLIRCDTSIKKNCRLAFHTLIRKVWVNGIPVFDGSKSSEDDNFKDLFPVFDYKHRNLRFQFAAPFFEAETKTLYQCLLEGYNKDWTALSKETQKEYTNLDPGIYTFRVQARNVYENLSKEAVFQFKVLLPWYQTWWAFSLYILAFFFIVFLMVKWRSWKLVQEKQKLEQIIKERTQKINDQKQQLQEQAEKLKEMDKVKSRFFANISHEFRTPLTLIMGPLEQILPACREEKQKKQLKMMLRNSRRLLALINQLLELSKFDSGKVKLQASRQNIIPFLKGMVGSFEIAAAENDLELTFQPGEEEIELYMDPGKIETVMVNLLGNAVKFTPAGGKITVTAKKHPGREGNFPSGWLEIGVCDTGPGIPREQLANIFDRFYQADTVHEHYQKGTGIGLAIAKEIAELHHGTIDVHSREGRDSGTEFIIRLPLGDAHLEPDEIIERSVPSSPGQIRGEISRFEQREEEEEDVEAGEDTDIETDLDMELHGKDIILVVEDSADVREYIKGALEPLYRVVEAADGREGMEKAREIIPDLVISDVMMPEADGYELCRELKNQRDTSHIPIILLTAKAAEENIIEGLETGADDYITKPFNTKILCARIKNLIDLRRHFQETIHREMTLKPVQKSVSQMDKEFVRDLQEVINKNIADPEFNVEELCKRLYMGRTTLYRKILALTGEPPTEFIRSYRLKRGAELLKKGMGSVLEVAFEVGFSSANYFSKCFKKKFHQLPSSFQASEAKSK